MSKKSNGNHPRTPEDLAAWMVAWMRDNLKLEDTAITGEKTFVQAGMDSVHAMMLVGDLEDLLDRRLSPTLAWDHPTVDALAGHLAGTGDAPASPAEAAEDLLLRIDGLSEEEVDRLLEEHGNPGES